MSDTASLRIETGSPTAGARVERHVWLMVGVLFLCTLLVQGIALGGIVIFDDRILDALDVSRGAFKFRDLIYILSASLSCLVMAWLCEKLGVRMVVVTGLIALSVVLAGYSFLDSVYLLYVLQALLGFSYACVHVVVLMVVLARWFDMDDPRRGIALGICVSGASCGAVLMSQLVAALLGHFEWRAAFLVLALLPFLVMPFAWLAIRPPRDADAGDWKVSRDGALGFSIHLLASRLAGVLMLAIIPIFYVSACVASHIVLMLRDSGLSTATAAGAVSTLFIAGLIGKFGSGFLLLRLRLATAWLMLMSLMLIGSLLLLAAPISAYLPSLALIGVGWGGCFPLAQLKIAEVYPGPALAQVLGVFVVFESIGSATGAWLTAVMYDAIGNYTLPFAINAVLLALGIAMSLLAEVMRRKTHTPIQYTNEG